MLFDQKGVGGQVKAKHRYKVNVTFQGTATLEVEASTPDEARLLAGELTPADLARQGHADVLSFKVAAREVTPTAALSGEHQDDSEEDAPRPTRPSGWYRPL